jgi:arginyl-tRNA synthetase
LKYTFNLFKLIKEGIETFLPDDHADISGLLASKISRALDELYNHEAEAADIKLEMTRKEFTGDYTLVVFPYLKVSKKNPEETAKEIGVYLLENCQEVVAYNVIKGFLNLVIDDNYWISFLFHHVGEEEYGFRKQKKVVKVIVEYSSPNTNKPLHLGHVRNNLLGYSVAEILKANGYEVNKVNLVNDRGIHICKSMLAWMKFGNGETPESAGLKGDKLVGNYYVLFDRKHNEQKAELIAAGMDEKEAAKKTPLMQEAQELLKKWEEGDKKVLDVWKMMNSWVYAGFEKSYKRLGVDFDKYYYESGTYLLGKELVEEGVEKGVFTRKADGGAWVDLTTDGLDEKLLLRPDGTSVYITQDLGTAQLKFEDYRYDRSIYVVGNEQDYHFRVLKLVLKKLGKKYAEGIFHLSYGMVDLPSGKMKSREGTVVDADDLMEEMHETAARITTELGKTEGMNEKELESLHEMIGMGALKYFLLKVDPQKRMLFNPEESIDFQGNTGPFIQYTCARINSLLEHSKSQESVISGELELAFPERELIIAIHRFPAVIKEAGEEMNPGLIVNYVYELAKHYNRFYHELPVLKETDPNKKTLRILLSEFTLQTLRKSLKLLGIAIPKKM